MFYLNVNSILRSYKSILFESLILIQSNLHRQIQSAPKEILRKELLSHFAWPSFANHFEYFGIFWFKSLHLGQLILEFCWDQLPNRYSEQIINHPVRYVHAWNESEKFAGGKGELKLKQGRFFVICFLNSSRILFHTRTIFSSHRYLRLSAVI